MPTPSTPTNFLLQQGNAQVLLTWDLSTSGATSYPVQYSTDGVTYANVSPDPATNSLLLTSATTPAVVVGTNYYFQIAAKNGTGTSAYTIPQQIVPTRTGQLTLGQIRLAAQQRADFINNPFVTTTEWNSYINQSYFELYDLLITCYEDFFLAPAITFLTDGSSYMYNLPDGTNYAGAPLFYKLYGVDCGLNTADNSYISLTQFNFMDRNKFIFPNLGSTFLGVFSLQYRLLGNKLMFIPTPSGNQVIRVWYYPRMTQLLQDTDILDSVSGWEEYVIVDAAIKAMQKEESDVSVLMAQKMALKQRIEETAMNRDAGQPQTITDARSNMRWGRGYGPNGNGASAGW